MHNQYSSSPEPLIVGARRRLRSFATFLVAAAALGLVLSGCAGGDNQPAGAAGQSGAILQADVAVPSVVLPPTPPPLVAGRVFLHHAGFVESFELDGFSGRFFDKREHALFSDGVNFTQPMALHPGGRFAYVPANADNFVAKYTVDPQSGIMTFASTFPTGDGPIWAELNPFGSVLFVVNRQIDRLAFTLSAYSVDQQSGNLRAFGGMPLPLAPVGDFVLGIAVHPTGNWLFVHQGNRAAAIVKVYAVDTRHGTVTAAGSVAVGATRGTDFSNTIAVSPAGPYVYAVDSNSASVAVLAFNEVTGALTQTGLSVATPGVPLNIAIDPAGNFAYVGHRDGVVMAHLLNFWTGAIFGTGEPVQAFAQFGGSIRDLSFIAVDPSGSFVYSTSDLASLGTDGFGIDPETGKLTHLGGFPLAGLNTKRILFTVEAAPPPLPTE